jgi:hypothetical protein
MLRSTPTKREAIIAKLENAWKSNPDSNIKSTLNSLRDYKDLEALVLNMVALHDDILLKLTDGTDCDKEIDNFMIQFGVVSNFMSNHPDVQRIYSVNDSCCKRTSGVNRNSLSYAMPSDNPHISTLNMRYTSTNKTPQPSSQSSPVSNISHISATPLMNYNTVNPSYVNLAPKHKTKNLSQALNSTQTLDSILLDVLSAKASAKASASIPKKDNKLKFETIFNSFVSYIKKFNIMP